MRIGWIICLAASMLFLVPAPLDSQDTVRAGNQIFRMPPGWTRTDSGPSTVLSPSDQPPNMVVLMLTGYPLTEDFRAAFDRSVQGMIGSLRVVTRGPVQSRHTPEGVDLLATTAELQAAKGSRASCYYMAASVRGRFEVLMFMAGSQALFQRYWPAVQQFIPTWSFANLREGGAPPGDAAGGNTAPAGPGAGSPASDGLSNNAAPALPANRLQGVYAGFKYNYVTVLGVVQKRAVADYFSFFADGTVFQGLPQTGLAAFSMARECPKNPIPCGAYQVNGEQISIVTNRGTYRQVGMRTAGGLQIGDRQYTLQGDIAALGSQAIEGVWGRADAQPGEDLARKFIRFTRDGRFVDQGLVTTVCSSDISTGSPRFERPAGQGTYRLAAYTIILRYADGYQRPLGVTVPPADMNKPALPQLFVNTYTLARR